MKKAVVFIAEGFEEIEALSVVDILRRGGVETTTVSITEDPFVAGAHGIEITTDAVNEYAITDEDIIVLPGGLPGADNLCKSKYVTDAIKLFAKENRNIGAICAAPYILGQLGVLKGKKATCYPGFEPHLDGAEYTASAVEVDGNFITANGPASAYKFGLAILARLMGEDVAQNVAKGMLIK